MSNLNPANLTDFQWHLSPGLTAHLMAVSHYIHRRSMAVLAEEYGHRNLSMTYEGYMTLLAERDMSPGELAEKLGISKQACSKTLRDLEKQQLIIRRPNPADSRSRLISLSPVGMQLLNDGIAVSNRIQHDFASHLATEELQGLSAVLEKLCSALAIAVPDYESLTISSRQAALHKPARLNELLPRLNAYCYRRLILDLAEHGFANLKPGFSQVIGLIVPDGGTIQHIANVVGVSKQAIAATAQELENLGYIYREADSNDKRQMILRVSPLGRQLLEQARTRVNALEASLAEHLSPAEFTTLKDGLSTLYHQATDHYHHPGQVNARIRHLSRTLVNELGHDGARTLAHQLLMITKGDQ